MADQDKKTIWYDKQRGLLVVGVLAAVVVLFSIYMSVQKDRRKAAEVPRSSEQIRTSEPPTSITDFLTGATVPNSNENRAEEGRGYLNDPIPEDLETSAIVNDDLGRNGMPRTGGGGQGFGRATANPTDLTTMSPEEAQAYNSMVVTLASPLLANAEGTWGQTIGGSGTSREEASGVQGSPRAGGSSYSRSTTGGVSAGRAASRGGAVPYKDFNALNKAGSSSASTSLTGDHGRQYVNRERSVDYELPAGNVLEGYLVTAVNSDLPGDVVLQISRDVYDMRQETLLIPKGSRFIGRYEDQIAYGQNRVLQIWDRLIMPSGDQFDVPQSRGVDLVGRSGVAGKVNNHWGKLIASATLVAVMGTAYELTQREQNSGFYPSRSATIGSSISNEVARVGAQLAQRGLSVQPTIEIPAGHPVKVLVRSSWVFPEAYERVW